MTSWRQHFCLYPAALLFWLFFLFAIQPPSCLFAEEKIEALNAETINTLGEMALAVQLLSSRVDVGVRQGRFSYATQRLILTKTGDCISRLAAIKGLATAGGKTDNLLAGELFEETRRIILAIQAINKKTISDMQEHHLDKLKDPVAFFHSDAWKQPNNLVSITGYWLGWNGYYASGLYEKNSSEKKRLLGESIDAFTGAFIDFEEDAVIAKCLLGRALCYKALGAYEHAVKDLSAVKRKVPRGEVLFFRCIYEEAAISYLTGNHDTALVILDGVYEDFAESTIPRDILSGYNQLRAKILLAMLEKEKPSGPENRAGGDKKFKQTFEGLKTLAETDRSLAAEFYRYVQSRVNSLAHLSYEALGAVGTVAVADYYFDHRHYAKALGYYLYIHSSAKKIPEDMKDDIRFRLAYIYCKEKKWRAALPFLETFSVKFPDSPVMGKAARLYYVAATNVYTENATAKTYQRYIHATKCYLRHCDRCPDQSEAHFQLGKYYQKKGRVTKALAEFKKVGEDSPNYGVAISNLLQAKVDTLEALRKKGPAGSARMEKEYPAAVKLMGRYQAYQAGAANKRRSVAPAPHMIILEAKLHSFGPADAFRRSIETLDGFETSFPSEKTLALVAANLRITCYQKLAMHGAAEKEVARFMAAVPVDMKRYVFLQDIANRFYQAAESYRAQKAHDAASRSAATALRIYKALHDISLAHPVYSKDVAAVRLRMARIYEDEKDPKQAARIYLELLKDNPNSANAVYNLGAIYESLGDWKNALASWRRFSDGVKAGTHHWYESRYRTANAFVHLGNKEKACTILKMTMVLHPDFPDEALKEKFFHLKSKTCVAE